MVCVCKPCTHKASTRVWLAERKGQTTESSEIGQTTERGPHIALGADWEKRALIYCTATCGELGAPPAAGNDPPTLPTESCKDG